jgi:hypothetical protein
MTHTTLVKRDLSHVRKIRDEAQGLSRLVSCKATPEQNESTIPDPHRGSVLTPPRFRATLSVQGPKWLLSDMEKHAIRTPENSFASVIYTLQQTKT